MYTDDNPEKLDRFLDIYDQADYIVISSNRQWGTLPRIPERFPLTTLYYRTLLGCPEDQAIDWCYRVAQPGMFQGQLGFELVQVFQSDPSDRRADALTTSLPKRPSPSTTTPRCSSSRRRRPTTLNKLSAAQPGQFCRVRRITPKKAQPYPANLLLPDYPPGRTANRRHLV